MYILVIILYCIYIQNNIYHTNSMLLYTKYISYQYYVLKSEGIFVCGVAFTVEVAQEVEALVE